MATLNIKDPRVHELAVDLAKRRGSSMTAVIRSALEEAMEAELERHALGVDEKLERMRMIVARTQAFDAPVLTDDDLYDPATGLPW